MNDLLRKERENMEESVASMQRSLQWLHEKQRGKVTIDACQTTDGEMFLSIDNGIIDSDDPFFSPEAFATLSYNYQKPQQVLKALRMMQQSIQRDVSAERCCECRRCYK